MGPDGKTYFS